MFLFLKGDWSLVAPKRETTRVLKDEEEEKKTINGKTKRQLRLPDLRLHSLLKMHDLIGILFSFSSSSRALLSVTKNSLFLFFRYCHALSPLTFHFYGCTHTHTYKHT